MGNKDRWKARTFSFGVMATALLVVWNTGCSDSTPKPQRKLENYYTPTGQWVGPDPEPNADKYDPNAEFLFPSSNLSGSAVVLTETDLPASMQRDGFLSLFDGQSLFGWQAEEGTQWAAANGVIRCAGGEPNLLITTVPFDDFELFVDYQLQTGGNSGVFVRTAEAIQDVGVDTYEVNIAAFHPDGYTTGSLVNRMKASGVDDSANDGQWHTLRIVCDGARIQTFVDEESACDLLQTEDSPGLRKTGRIGLQYREGSVAFRRIFLRPLNLEPQFVNDLDGWRVVQAKLKDGSTGQAKFTSLDGGVHVQGGLGFLESEATYDNFVVQFTATTGVESVNSGLFFRNETGTPEAPSNGYELQVDNSTKSGDRSQPANGGTGGIFRRQDARFVPGDDLTPVCVTLLADGDHFASWVNGYPVMDWTDTRADDPNPRKGRRLEAGHFALQAHDPTTDVTITDFAVRALK